MSSTIGQACLDALKTALGSVINFELTNEAASDKKYVPWRKLSLLTVYLEDKFLP